MFYSLDAELIQWLNLAAVALIPTLVAIVTKEVASRRVKALTLVALNAVAAVLAGVLDAGGYTYSGIAYLFVQNVVFSGALYYTVSKPIGLAGAGSAPAKAFGGDGIG
jgi:hypothetical protein